MKFDSVFIGVPSKGRPQAIVSRTLDLLSGYENASFKIFVEPQESFLYKYYCGKENVVVLPKNDQGVMYAYQYMRQYARGRDYKYIFQIDDDVKRFVRVDTDDKHEQMDLTIQDIIEYMNENASCGGVRFTQYRYWLFTKKKLKKWTHLNPLLQGVCILRLSALREIDNRMAEFTDTVTTMYLWEDNYYTLNYGLSGLDVLQNINKGGCQMLDRKQMSLTTIELMKKDFPEVKQKSSTSYWGIDIDCSYYLDKLYKVL